MSYPEKMLDDGLCNAPAMEIPARELLGTVCVLGGADCPLFDRKQDAQAVLDRVKADPTVTIRLTSDADRIPHCTMLGPANYADLDRDGVFNRKRDLDVLQALGLAPGDTRRAYWLYELLLERVETPDGICACNTCNWEGCPLARSGAYESIRAKGYREIVYYRSAEDMAEARRLSADRLGKDPVLCIRPHHLMCMACWYGRTQGEGVRPNDTIDVFYQRIRRDPDVEIMLVEGNCEVCHCCDGFHPETTRCVHSCGLIRDYKKDLDVLQKLGMMPGDKMNARDLFRRLFERIPSTRDVCGFGTDVVTGQEWTICGGLGGSAAYVKARETLKL